ncbi:MAG: hypothetical protein ACI90V_004540 [Bacillariaceae sp.]|jgi:hypothetical protein
MLQIYMGCDRITQSQIDKALGIGAIIKYDV